MTFRSPSHSDPVELTMRLVAIDSTSGQEGAVIAWVDAYLAERGWQTKRIPVTAGRDDLYAAMSERPRVVLSTHLDTVPPFIPPRRDENRIHGRGACDAKGIAAAMICAAEQLRDRDVPVALLFVVGEEVTHDGAHAANEAIARGTLPDSCVALVNGEPTESKIGVGTKGAIRVIVRTEGEAAHSAYPHLGRSATSQLVRLLAELDDLELPRDSLLGDTTVNVGQLAGGVADNVVAPWAEARLMIRLVSPAEEIKEIFERWADGRARLEWGPMVPPVHLAVVPGLDTAVVAFATDIPVMPGLGTPYLFGPGSIHVAHRDDEFLEIAELRAAVDVYVRIAQHAAAQSLRNPAL